VQEWFRLPTMTAAGYVGIEPEAAGWLAASSERVAEDAGGTARRVAALFAEAGEHDTVTAGLRELEAWLQWQAGDIRRRATLATFDGRSGVDPTCQVPLSDPLVRAARAVWSNAARLGQGAGHSAAETATMVWQLVPGNTGWTQAWVDLGAGLVAAARDPKAAVAAMVDVQTLDEEGFSYWIGGFVPDAAAMLLGGAGAAKLGVRAADAAHAVTAGHRLADAARRLPGRGGAPGVDVPRHAGVRPFRDWRLERQARANVRAEDGRATNSPSARGKGHSATMHSRRTSLRRQLRRAVTGRKPDGTFGYQVNGSRFFRWQDQDEAIRRAKAQWTGERDAIEIDLQRPIGEGHMKETLEYRRTTVAVVRFDDHGNAYTSYPFLEKGGPLP
jgi:hypothetical protein